MMILLYVIWGRLRDAIDIAPHAFPVAQWLETSLGLLLLLLDQSLLQHVPKRIVGGLHQSP